MLHYNFVHHDNEGVRKYIWLNLHEYIIITHHSLPITCQLLHVYMLSIISRGNGEGFAYIVRFLHNDNCYCLMVITQSVVNL